MSTNAGMLQKVKSSALGPAGLLSEKRMYGSETRKGQILWMSPNHRTGGKPAPRTNCTKRPFNQMDGSKGSGNPPYVRQKLVVSRNGGG